MKKSISILLICLIYSNTIAADELAGTFLRTSDQIQAINIGGNLTAVASGAMAPHFNPAGLVQFTGKGFQAILNSASLDRKAHNLSAFLNLRGDVGFGFSWIHARVNDIRGRSGSGQFTGKIEDAANAFTVAFAFKLGNALKAGLSMKNMNHQISSPFQSKGEANGHGFNFGLQYSFNNKGSLGVTLQNIKSGLNWKVKRGNKTRNTHDSIKSRVTVGVAYSPVDMLHLGGDLIIEHDNVATIGASWKINELLSISTGLREIGGTNKFGTFSNGFSVHPMRNQNITLHYAYISDPIGAGELMLAGIESYF